MDSVHVSFSDDTSFFCETLFEKTKRKKKRPGLAHLKILVQQVGQKWSKY